VSERPTDYSVFMRAEDGLVPLGSMEATSPKTALRRYVCAHPPIREGATYVVVATASLHEFSPKVETQTRLVF